MRAGKLDRRVTIQEVTEGQDAYGGTTETWNNLATNPTVWAAKMDLRGREFFDTQKVNAELATTFRLRYRSDITPKMRVVYDGLNWDIHAVVEYGRKEGLDLYCSAAI